MSAIRSGACFLLVALAGLPLAAQQPYDFYARGPYRPAVPRPDSLLGYPLGSRQTMYREQQDALERMVQRAPDRARTELIGRTWEGRPMRLIIISAPENLARLDQIRADLAALADPRTTTPGQAAAIAQRDPVVVMLSHSIHGDEPAGFEAALATTYQLLASEEPATQEILRNVVTIINPSQNPDGHERFAAWSNSVAVGSDEPASLEHDEPWDIVGRYNHYRFDMNRDLIAQSQPETRALAGAILRWHPQVFADLHSTTAQYFFPPDARPINTNVPAATRDALEEFGRGNAAAFDAHGWLYYVRDVFDLFYAGYWDSWPVLNGAVGMTFESDGGPELHLRKEDGTVTTFRDGIAHHEVASLATLATAARTRETRLRDYYDFRASGMARAARSRLRRVVWVEGDHPDRARQLAGLLERQGIEVQRTTAPLRLGRAHSYLGGPPSSRVIPAGAWLVDLAQPQARLAAALLEPDPGLDSAFIRSQLARYARNGERGPEAEHEGYEFYDITAWALPQAYGLDAWWTDETTPVSAVTATSPPDSARGGVTGGPARVAYVFPDDRDGAARLALHLLGEGFAVGSATQPFRADSMSWPRGTFVLRVVRNPDSLHQRVTALAREDGVRVTAIQSGFPDSGQYGVGSEMVQALHPARVLLAAGDGISTTAFGDFWYYLEQELDVPVVPVRLSSLGRMRLDDYNILILPGGWGGGLFDRLGEHGARRLREWVNSGGLVVAAGGAVSLLSHKDLELTTVKPVGSGDSGKEGAGEKGKAEKDSSAADSAVAGVPLASPEASHHDRPETIQGSVFRATLDTLHWLAYGYTRISLPVFLEGVSLAPSQKGENPVVFTGDSLRLGGFAWPGNTEKFLRKSVWAAVENVGRGHVVLFAEDPLFRAFWRGTARLVSNAILLGTGR